MIQILLIMRALLPDLPILLYALGWRSKNRTRLRMDLTLGWVPPGAPFVAADEEVAAAWRHKHAVGMLDI